MKDEAVGIGDGNDVYHTVIDRKTGDYLVLQAHNSFYTPFVVWVSKHGRKKKKLAAGRY